MAQGVVLSEKNLSSTAALVWRNMGELEEQIWERQQQWDEEQETFDSMQAALEQGGLRVLNRPNLLNQHFWTTIAALNNRKVVYGRASRISGTSYPYLTSMREPTETTQTTAPTAEQIAAACAIYSVTENNVTTYHIFTDGDDFKASVAQLAAADQITEPDGELYDYAIQYDITANSAYGNSEWLLYYQPHTPRTYYSDVTPASQVRNYGQVEEMIPGRTYTLECWVRVLSGDGVWMRMGYGNSYTNQPYNDNTNHRSGVSDIIKVEGAGKSNWQRVSWTFEFNPTGDWYTETSEAVTVDGVAHTRVTRSYNWFKKVGFAVLRKYTATVQICGFRLVEGRLFVCDTYDDLLKRVVEIENGDENIMANFAEADGQTATSAHAVGDVIIVGRQLYKVTAAIAIGDTITDSGNGANVESTTVAALLAPLLALTSANGVSF